MSGQVASQEAGVFFNTLCSWVQQRNLWICRRIGERWRKCLTKQTVRSPALSGSGGGGQEEGAVRRGDRPVVERSIQRLGANEIRAFPCRQIPRSAEPLARASDSIDSLRYGDFYDGLHALDIICLEMFPARCCGVR